MPDHLLTWLAGVIAGTAATIAVAVAARWQLLPEVVDPSFVLTGAGLGGVAGAVYGATRRFPSERLGRIVLLGNIVGAAIFAALFTLGIAGVL